MEITKQKAGSKLLVKVEGRIDTTTAADFGTQINDELDEITDLIIDFEEVIYISSVGLRVVLELQKRMNTQGRMKIINMSESVFEVFQMTGFTNIVTIE